MLRLPILSLHGIPLGIAVAGAVAVTAALLARAGPDASAHLLPNGCSPSMAVASIRIDPAPGYVVPGQVLSYVAGAANVDPASGIRCDAFDVDVFVDTPDAATGYVLLCTIPVIRSGETIECPSPAAYSAAYDDRTGWMTLGATVSIEGNAHASSDCIEPAPRTPGAGQCFSASAAVYATMPDATSTPNPNPLTPTPTPTATFTATPTGFTTQDADGDGWIGFGDNCPFAFNPGQGNNDRNYLFVAPSKLYVDNSRAQSDSLGDACDFDDDNDGLADAGEANGCASSSAPTSPTAHDSDGDRVLDGVECDIGTDPANAASAPSPAVCHATGNADGDRVLDAREMCFYGTSSSSADSDADGAADPCEIANINADGDVNIIDLQQIASSAPPSGAAGYIVDFDTTKDGSINVIDLQFAAVQLPFC